jgi:hypothetical protein
MDLLECNTRLKNYISLLFLFKFSKVLILLSIFFSLPTVFSQRMIPVCSSLLGVGLAQALSMSSTDNFLLALLSSFLCTDRGIIRIPSSLKYVADKDMLPRTCVMRMPEAERGD